MKHGFGTNLGYGKTVQVFFGQKQPERQRELRSWEQCPLSSSVPLSPPSVAGAARLCPLALPFRSSTGSMQVWMPLLLISMTGTVHSAQPWLQLHQWHRHLLLSDCPGGGEAHSVCHLVLRNQQQPLNTDTLPRNFCFPCDRDIGVIAGLYFCFYGYEISLGCLWYMNLVWTLGYRFSSAC